MVSGAATAVVGPGAGPGAVAKACVAILDASCFTEIEQAI